MYVVIGRKNCEYCDKTKELLDSKGLEYVYIDIKSGEFLLDTAWKWFLKEQLKVTTVPQIFKVLGGYDDLRLETMHVRDKD